MENNAQKSLLPSNRRRTGAPVTFIAVTVALMLVVSSGPASHADPVDTDEPPVISVPPAEHVDQDDPAAEPAQPPPGTFIWLDRDEPWPTPVGDGRLPATSTLPATYDLRTAHPTWLTGVRDRGSWNTSWAFAASQAAEASLVRNGVLTGNEPAERRQISPLHLVQSVYYTDTFKANTDNPLQANGPYQIYTNLYQAAAAWSHWYGAKAEAAHRYPSNQTVAPDVLSAASLRSSDYHLRSAWWLRQPRHPYVDFNAANLAAIKEAVYSYGPAAAVFAGSQLDTSFYNSTYQSLYTPNLSPDAPSQNYFAMIIGWDDNFSRTRFNRTPDGDGAFLIQNNSGSKTAYFWLSYYDYTIGDVMVFDLISSATKPGYQDPYGWTGQYAHDELGFGGIVINFELPTVIANRFTAREDTTLRATQFFTTGPDVTYKIEVYVGKIAAASPTAGGIAQVLTTSGGKSVSGFLPHAGYNTVTFETPVILKKGQQFSIVITMAEPWGGTMAAAEAGRDKGALTIAYGESFVKSGGKWYDLIDLMQGLSIDWLGNLNIIGLTSPRPLYTLTFDPNGGVVAQASKTVAYGAQLGSLQTPTRTGCTFAGWYTQPVGGVKYTSSTIASFVADKTIYAHWTGKKYTLTFKANGGTTPKTSGKVKKTKSVTFGKSYGALPKTTRKGHKFDGWYTAKTGGTLIAADATVATAKNMTVYAHWTPKQYTVKLNPRSGTVAEPSVTVTYGKKYGPLPVPTRDGYSFKGWYTKSSGGTKITASKKVTITATQTLYAHWKKLKASP